MDANRPVTSEAIAFAFIANVRMLTEYEFHRLYTEIEFDVQYLSAVRAALEQNACTDDISSLQHMVDEIGRFEKRKDSEVDEFSRVLIDNIFSQLDRLGVDYRRLVFEDFDHIVTIAGDF